MRVLMAQSIVHLSSVVGSPLLDSNGGRLGRVEDVVAKLDPEDEAPPPVIGLKARIGGREMFLPCSRIERMEPAAVRTATTELNLGQFERRPSELLLRADLLDRSLINTDTALLVTAREVELTRDDGTWRVAGIDPSFRARLRRLVPRRFRDHDAQPAEFVAWQDMEPFGGHVPTLRMKLTARQIARLHPAQIADLVEAASHEEGEEILDAVRENEELEADVFEELDDEHQVEFVRERSDKQAATLFSRMASDDAADLLLELDQDRRLPILELMPPEDQRKITAILGHNPSTAGGLMDPDFVSVPADATVEEALDLVRSSELSPAQASIICVVDDRGVFIGAVPLATLILAQPQQRLADLIDERTPAVMAETDLPEVATLMSDWNLIALPVVDGEGRPEGVISVDDILELLLPEDWRRRAAGARS
jgi:CBS domain-containing protein